MNKGDGVPDAIGAHPPFGELVKLSPTTIAGEMRQDRHRRVLGE
jgi:hypothetical protein